MNPAFRRRLIATLLLLIGFVERANAGKVGGNGVCYDLPMPPKGTGTGKYCGSRVPAGSRKDSDCDCGVFAVANPFPFDGVYVSITPGSPLITSVVLPNVGDDRFGIQFWDGTAFTRVVEVAPNARFDFPFSGVGKFRIVGIRLPEDVDLGSLEVFPMRLSVVGDKSFEGSVEAFSSRQPISLIGKYELHKLKLSWFGGFGPFIIQVAESKRGPWSDLSEVDSRSFTFSSHMKRFFRVKGDGDNYSGVLRVRRWLCGTFKVRQAAQ